MAMDNCRFVLEETATEIVVAHRTAQGQHLKFDRKSNKVSLVGAIPVQSHDRR
jgi:hypothetical protein